MLLTKLHQTLFSIPRDEATFAARGFSAGDPAIQQRLEHIGFTFLEGYHLALKSDSPAPLAAGLAQVDVEFVGFAYEGAGMALALRDFFTPPWPHRRRRLQALLEGPGDAHTYMIHVGAGWMYARLRRPLTTPPAHLSPLLGWLALDGYGFHEGYFHWPQAITRQTPPSRLSGYARRAFDQGLGRSLWFVLGAQVDPIVQTIHRFRPERRADLWAGVGLACTYAGGVRLAEVDRLRWLAGPDNAPHLAQGAAFAAKARQRAGYLAAHTQLACEALCDVTAYEAAAITDEALLNLPPDTPAEPAFEVWRQRIRQRFTPAIRPVTTNHKAVSSRFHGSDEPRQVAAVKANTHVRPYPASKRDAP